MFIPNSVQIDGTERMIDVTKDCIIILLHVTKLYGGFKDPLVKNKTRPSLILIG